MAQGHGFFAGGSELGPVAGDRGIQLQFAFGHQLQRGYGGEGLGAGKQVGNGVAVPGFGAVLVSGTAPEVENGFPTNADAQRRATLLRIVEKRRKRFAHRFELSS